MPKIDPLVSIVIPTYNRASLLRRAVHSVLEQTVTEWEVLIIDNHSDDDTDEVVGNFRDPRIRLLKIHNNGIIAASRNMGIREAQGRWVALLDSDDWWTPEKLEVSLSALNEGYDIVYHDLTLITNSLIDRFSRKVNTWQLSPPVYRDLVMRGNAITTSSVVVRRSLMLKVGGLSEHPDMVAAEDFECWLRLAKVTERFCRVHGTHGYYWMGGENFSSTERKIRNLTAIAGLHFAKEIETTSWPIWFRYSMGRSCFQLKKYQEAKRIIAMIPMKSVTVYVFIKILYMRLRIFFMESSV